MCVLTVAQFGLGTKQANTAGHLAYVQQDGI